MERYLEAVIADIEVKIDKIGEDYLIEVSGGEKPHIGCTVIAQSRPSLNNDNNAAATISEINLLGHKDNYICRILAEKLCISKKATVVCTGGYHSENMSETEIAEVIAEIKEFAAKF